MTTNARWQDESRTIVLIEIDGVTCAVPATQDNAIFARFMAEGVEVRAHREPPTLEEVKAVRLAQLAAYRYARESAGVEWSGALIDTDPAARGNLAGKVLGLQFRPFGPGETCKWKARNAWLDLDAAGLVAMGAAVADHVQACFDAEAQHQAAIAALDDIAAVEGYDFTGGWP